MFCWSERREKFRAILTAEACIYLALVFDLISARIANDIGYEMGLFAGLVALLTVLGAFDVVVLTLSEFVDQACRICRAEVLPLMVDVDYGYGNALNVMRMVEELEGVGISGMSIEDMLLPTSFGNTGKPQLLFFEEGVGKMRAALVVRSDLNLVIAGRISAVMLIGIEDVIVRVKVYEVEGVDVIFLVGLKTRVELEAVASEIKLFLIVGGIGDELMDMDYFA